MIFKYIFSTIFVQECIHNCDWYSSKQVDKRLSSFILRMSWFFSRIFSVVIFSSLVWKSPMNTLQWDGPLFIADWMSSLKLLFIALELFGHTRIMFSLYFLFTRNVTKVIQSIVTKNIQLITRWCNLQLIVYIKLKC